MVDKLVGRVAESIETAFDRKYKVYTESVHQNAQKPCFFVECEEAERVEMLNRNFFVRVHVKISFESDSDEKRLETDSVTATVFDVLGVIKIKENCFNGRKIHGAWEKNRFVVRAIYDVWVEKDTEECALMESIEVKGIHDGVEIYES